MSGQIRHFYEFGPFRIDTVNRLLLCNGEPVSVKAKAVETLLLLVQRNGEVVEKEELMKQLWPDSFVEEANLTQTIYILRKALGEGQYIETIPRRGYRFVAEVRDWEDSPGDVLLIREKTRTSLSFEEEADGDGAQPVIDLESPGAEPGVEIVKRLAPPQSIQQVRAAPQDHLRPAGKRALVIALAIGVVVIAIIVAAIIFWPRAHGTPFANFKLAKFTTTGNVIKAAISPDGKYLAHVVVEGGLKSVWLRQVVTGRDFQVLPPAHVEWFYGLTFSHDGNYLYYVSQEMNRVGILYRVPSLGGTPLKLLDDVDSPVTLSPDDRRLAFIRYTRPEGRLMIANADGSNEQKLAASTPESPFQLGPTWQVPPAWSPDGKTIACVVGLSKGGGRNQTIWSFAAENGQNRQLTSEQWVAVGRIEWVKNGGGLLVAAAVDEANTAQQVWFVSLTKAVPERITNDLNDYRDLSLTEDAKTLVAVTAEKRGNVWIAPAAEVDRTSQLTFTNYDGTYGVSWTPDGKLVYTAQAGGEQNLWLTGLDGKPPLQLTSHAGFNQQPNVSADGKYVVFVSNRTGREHLWRIDIDGRNPLELTHGDADSEPSVSPDGKWIVYDAQSKGRRTLMRLGTDGGEPLPLSAGVASTATFSPDGKWLAFYYRAEFTSPNKIAVMPFAGGPVRVIQDLPAHYGRFCWMPDSQALAYSAKQGGGNIWVLPVDGSPARQLTHEKTNPIVVFDWSRDGRWLAYSLGSLTSDVVLITDISR